MCLPVQYFVLFMTFAFLTTYIVGFPRWMLDIVFFFHFGSCFHFHSFFFSSSLAGLCSGLGFGVFLFFFVIEFNCHVSFHLIIILFWV